MGLVKCDWVWYMNNKDSIFVKCIKTCKIGRVLGVREEVLVVEMNEM